MEEITNTKLTKEELEQLGYILPVWLIRFENNTTIQTNWGFNFMDLDAIEGSRKEQYNKAFIKLFGFVPEYVFSYIKDSPTRGQYYPSSIMIHRDVFEKLCYDFPEEFL